jgi:hypothetical protein
MAGDLTPEQEAKVSQKRKDSPPSYYNADTQVRRSILQETEAALILTPATVKDNATRYIQAFLDKENRSPDYTDVLKLFSDAQIANVAAANQASGTLFSQFNSLRDGLLGSGESLISVGMSPLLKALNAGLGRLRKQHDTLLYRERHLAVATSRSSAALSEEQKRELQSWIPVLVSYP